MQLCPLNSYVLIVSLYYVEQNVNVVGAGLAPALIQGDRKGRPYTFRVL